MITSWPAFLDSSLRLEITQRSLAMVLHGAKLWGSIALGLLSSGSVARSIGPRDPVPAGYRAAPYYPTPYGGWLASWREAYAKAQALVSRMTLAEKTNITSGVGMWMGKTLLLSHTPFLMWRCN